MAKMYWIILIVFIVLFVLVFASNEKHVPSESNADKKDEIALCIGSINKDRENTEIIKQISDIIGKNYDEVKNILDFYNLHNNKNEDAEEYISPVLSTYFTMQEARQVRAKLKDIGVKCSFSVTDELLHNDEYNIDYESI